MKSIKFVTFFQNLSIISISLEPELSEPHLVSDPALAPPKLCGSLRLQLRDTDKHNKKIYCKIFTINQNLQLKTETTLLYEELFYDQKYVYQ
jgi:hypothetical protein